MGEALRWSERAYTAEGVERLLGLREGWGDNGHRDITVLDLLSRVRDPGGPALARETDPERWMAARAVEPSSEPALVLWDFLRALRRLATPEEPPDPETGKPVSDGPEWRQRALFTQAVVALQLCGFQADEIAAVLDPDGVLAFHAGMRERERLATVRALRARRERIRRVVLGRPKRDALGRGIRQPLQECEKCWRERPCGRHGERGCGLCGPPPCREHGRPEYAGGVAPRIARLMGGA